MRRKHELFRYADMLCEWTYIVYMKGEEYD